jgi:hypothetical protein
VARCGSISHRTALMRAGKWWDYLDQIWSAYETAEGLDVSVLPALQVRTRMLKEVAGREGHAE